MCILGTRAPSQIPGYTLAYVCGSHRQCCPLPIPDALFRLGPEELGELSDDPSADNSMVRGGGLVYST